MKEDAISPMDFHAGVVDTIILAMEENGVTAISNELFESLAALVAANDSRWMVFRAKLKAIPEVSIGEIEKAISNIAEKPASGKSEDTDSSRSVVDELVDMIVNAGDLFTSEDGEAFLDVEKNSSRETYALQSSDIKEWVAYSYYRDNGRSPKSLQIADAVNTAMGIAKHEGEVHPVKRRSAIAADGSYILDICNSSWQAYRFDENGFTVVDRPEVRFSRTKNCLPLMDPEVGGTLADFTTLVNVNKQDLPLLITAMLETLRPDTAYPAVEIRGEHGSAKSTTQKTVTSFFDPKIAGLRSRPKCVEDVFVAAQNSLIVHYNNMSHISPDLQDAFCCLSTGGAWASRTLYTNGEETIFDTKRPVFINGIGQLVTQPDLLSRLVVIECPTISVDNRISDQQFAKRLAKHGPRALYYLFSTFHRALKKLPNVNLDSLPRLADFARLGVAVTAVMREDNPELFDNSDEEPFMARYQKQLDEADEQSLEGSPAIDAMIEHLNAKGGNIESTVGQLFDDLQNLYGYRKYAWPKTARGFRNSLDRAMPALRAKGVKVVFQESRRNGRGINITSSQYRQNFANGIRPSQPSPHSLLRVLERENRLARDEREQRERDPRARYNWSVEDYDDLEFRANIENFASPQDMTPSEFLREGGGLDF